MREPFLINPIKRRKRNAMGLMTVANPAMTVRSKRIFEKKLRRSAAKVERGINELHYLFAVYGYTHEETNKLVNKILNSLR